MKTSTVAHAKAHFSALLSSVASGEEVLVTRRGHPIARIVPPPANAAPFDLNALRDFIASAPVLSGPTVAEMRAADQL